MGEEEQSAKAERFIMDKTVKTAESRRRRNVYVNVDLPDFELDKRGLPSARYARNKGKSFASVQPSLQFKELLTVRTSKYTLWSFVPRNLSEQFRRVANLYFLLLGA
jgi:phospholipid-translocating ATPase